MPGVSTMKKAKLEEQNRTLVAYVVRAARELARLQGGIKQAHALIADLETLVPGSTHGLEERLTRHVRPVRRRR